MLAGAGLDVDQTQVTSAWDRLWAKYKQARRITQTTGGAGNVEQAIDDPASSGDSDEGSSKKTRKRSRTDEQKRKDIIAFTNSQIYKKLDE
jgi:hypothetical protein